MALIKSLGYIFFLEVFLVFPNHVFVLNVAEEKSKLSLNFYLYMACSLLPQCIKNSLFEVLSFYLDILSVKICMLIFPRQSISFSF